MGSSGSINSCKKGDDIQTTGQPSANTIDAPIGTDESLHSAAKQGVSTSRTDHVDLSLHARGKMASSLKRHDSRETNNEIATDRNENRTTSPFLIPYLPPVDGPDHASISPSLSGDKNYIEKFSSVQGVAEKDKQQPRSIIVAGKRVNNTISLADALSGGTKWITQPWTSE